MKKEIKQLNKFKTIAMIMAAHPSAFEGQPYILEVRNEFTSKCNSIGLLLDNLAKPAAVLQNARREKVERLTAMVGNIIHIGLAYAISAGNEELKRNMSNYRKEYLKKSQYRLVYLAANVHQEMLPYEEQAVDAGLKTGAIAELNTLLEAYRQDLHQSHLLMSTRKSTRLELATLLKGCTQTLKVEIDLFAKNIETDQPDFYREYATIRNLNRRNRRRNKLETAESDISGTVTNSATGQPISMAIISIPETGLVVETDEDGYYLIDELPAGTFTLSCHAPGYNVPAKITAVIKDEESLVYDFSLTPAPLLN